MDTRGCMLDHGDMARRWSNISNARAPTGNNDHEKALMKSQRYDSMICANQGVQLVRSEQEASAI
jgi:hypothetical protein